MSCNENRALIHSSLTPLDLFLYYRTLKCKCKHTFNELVCVLMIRLFVMNDITSLLACSQTSRSYHSNHPLLTFPLPSPFLCEHISLFLASPYVSFYTRPRAFLFCSFSVPPQHTHPQLFTHKCTQPGKPQYGNQCRKGVSAVSPAVKFGVLYGGPQRSH